VALAKLFVYDVTYFFASSFLPSFTSSTTFLSITGSSSNALSSNSFTAGSIKTLPFDQLTVASLFASRNDHIAASVL